MMIVRYTAALASAALLDQRRAPIACTPQFFVNGDELRDWQGMATMPIAHDRRLA